MSVAMAQRRLENVSYDRFLKFTPKQKKDCILINEVKRFRFLYDRSEMNHKRAKTRFQAWEEIGKLMGMDGVDCMNRWKVLRDRYRRETKLRQKMSKLEASKKKKWMFYDMLSFLDPYLEERHSLSEDIRNDDEEENDPDDPDLSESYSDSFTLEDNDKDSSLESPESESAANVQFVRILVPPPIDVKPPRKYVKILPKTDKPPTPPPPLPQPKTPIIVKDEFTKGNTGLSSKNSQNFDTVDHLMSFMGNTIKQLPVKKQVKVSQDLTSAFFDIISNAEEDDDDEES